MGGFYGKKGISVEKLSHNDHIDLYRHLAFSAVGGFFGCHAVLVHGGIMGNAQTVNLLELLLDALRGDAYATALHLGALAVLPFIAWAYFLAVCERRHEALADEPETIPDNTAQPTSNA